MARSTCSGVISKLIPMASTTSTLPDLDDTPRPPCLATTPPAAATTNAEADDTLNKLAPSPPVPTISTACLSLTLIPVANSRITVTAPTISLRSEEHTSELQSRPHLVCRLLLEKKNQEYSIQFCRDDH